MTDHAHLIERLRLLAVRMINRGDSVTSELVQHAAKVIEEQDSLLKHYAELA